MSTVKTNAIIDASGGNTATINSMTPTADSLQGFRNRIINGDMRIDQRNAGASVTGGVGYTFPVDRFKFYSATSSKLSGQRSTVAPSGFTNSLLLTSLAATSPAAGDEYQLYHLIEGFNIADLGWGTAGAQTVTLSFWARSSLTGTFAGCLSNGTRSYIFTYTISAANTFEYKTITVAGDTTGTWDTTNGSGLFVIWDLGSGSNLNGTAGSWLGAFDTRTSGSVTLIGTNGATFYLTGVQLEKGSVATPFERRDYGRELMLCQRYYYRTTYGANSTTLVVGVVNSTTSAAQCGFTHPVTMRAAPTAGYSGVTVYDGGVNPAVTSISAQSSSTTHSTINVGATGGGLTVGRGACILAANSNQYLDYSSEL